MMLNLDLIFSGKIIATKKPPTLLKKYFDFWWEITKLIRKIYLKERYLSKYPDLNKFKRRDQREFRDKIKFEREKRKDLKSEVEMYAYYIKNSNDKIY